MTRGYMSMKEALEIKYGRKCEGYEEGCLTCAVWDGYEAGLLRAAEIANRITPRDPIGPASQLAMDVGETITKAIEHEAVKEIHDRR